MENTPNTNDVQQVFDALEVWINQRPGLDPCNYYDSWRDAEGRRAYRAEVRTIGKQRQRAHAALRDARRSTTQDYGLLMEAFRTAHSGRLEWKTTPSEGERLDGISASQLGLPKLEYCTGQYWPTEYRQAAASVLETYNRLLARKWEAEHPTPARTYTYHSIADVRRANAAAGNYWFNAATMRFFGTRIETALIGGEYFITSENQFDSAAPRRYSVRRAMPDGSIDTVGEFQAYRTLDEAREALREYRRAAR